MSAEITVEDLEKQALALRVPLTPKQCKTPGWGEIDEVASALLKLHRMIYLMQCAKDGESLTQAGLRYIVPSRAQIKNAWAINTASLDPFGPILIAEATPSGKPVWAAMKAIKTRKLAVWARGYTYDAAERKLLPPDLEKHCAIIHAP